MNEIKKNYTDIDKTIKNIRRELVTIEQDVKNIEKLGKNYVNDILLYQTLDNIKVQLNNLDTINYHSFKDHTLDWN